MSNDKDQSIASGLSCKLATEWPAFREEMVQFQKEGRTAMIDIAGLKMDFQELKDDQKEIVENTKHLSHLKTISETFSMFDMDVRNALLGKDHVPMSVFKMVLKIVAVLFFAVIVAILGIQKLLPTLLSGIP